LRHLILQLAVIRRGRECGKAEIFPQEDPQKTSE